MRRKKRKPCDHHHECRHQREAPENSPHEDDVGSCYVFRLHQESVFLSLLFFHQRGDVAIVSSTSYMRLLPK